MLLYPLSALFCLDSSSFIMSSVELILWYLVYRCAWPNHLNVCSSRNSNNMCASFIISTFLTWLNIVFSCPSQHAHVCPLYLNPHSSFFLTEQFSAPYVMAGVISCTVFLYMFLVCHIRTLFPSKLTGICLFCCFRISPPLRCQGTMSPDNWTVSLYGFVIVGETDGLWFTRRVKV